MPRGTQEFATPAQELINSSTSEDEAAIIGDLRQQLEMHHENAYPSQEEGAMMIARVLRDTTLAPIALEGSLLLLDRMHRGEMEIASAYVDQDIEDSWMETTVLRDDDLLFLRSMYRATQECFDKGLSRWQSRRPSVVWLWEEYGKNVYTTTQALVDMYRGMPENDIPQRGRGYIRDLSATPSTAYGQARLTNGNTARLTLAILVMEQRGHDNTLSGNELAQSLADNMDRASGLMGGRRNTVINLMNAPGDLHDPSYLDKMLVDNHYTMGVYAKHSHPPKPANCVGYTMLQPDQRDPRYPINRRSIESLRLSTDALSKVVLPKEAMRPGEANLRVAMHLAEQIWGEERPFLA